MKKTKKIAWKVPNGNPEHEIPDRAIVSMESDTHIATMSFDDEGEIQIFTLKKSD